MKLQTSELPEFLDQVDRDDRPGKEILITQCRVKCTMPYEIESIAGGLVGNRSISIVYRQNHSAVSDRALLSG